MRFSEYETRIVHGIFLINLHETVDSNRDIITLEASYSAKLYSGKVARRCSSVQQRRKSLHDGQSKCSDCVGKCVGPTAGIRGSNTDGVYLDCAA